MPWSALPESLNSPEKWAGTDNDTWYARWTLQFQGWFAFGPRAIEWWASWKFPPKVLFKIGGKGEWRYEFVQSLLSLPDGSPLSYYLLSRCQYYKRWAFVVQWPLMFTLHWYWREKDVPISGGDNWNDDFSIMELVFMYGPLHWDADLIYWILSFYIGSQWK